MILFKHKFYIAYLRNAYEIALKHDAPRSHIKELITLDKQEKKRIEKAFKEQDKVRRSVIIKI